MSQVCRHGRDVGKHPCERCEERAVVVNELDAWLAEEVRRGYYTGDSKLEAAMQANSRVREQLRGMR